MTERQGHCVTLALTALVGALFTNPAAAADGAASAPGGRPPHGPPPEAIAACNGKTTGTTVSFTGRRGETVTGVCELIGGVLAARPAGGGPPPPPGSAPSR